MFDLTQEIDLIWRKKILDDVRRRPGLVGVPHVVAAARRGEMPRSFSNAVL